MGKTSKRLRNLAIFGSLAGSVIALNHGVEASESSVSRIQGETRFETATEISRTSYGTAETVFITNAREFADALAGVPLAYQQQAPILPVQGNAVHQSVQDEISRLGATEAVILGGPAAVSESVESELAALGLSTRRLAGETRFETAEAIAEELLETSASEQAIVVDGFEFADAMSIAPFAAQEGRPIYLTRTNQLDNPELLSQFDNTIIVGGENAVSFAVENELNNPVRLAGDTRYDTNVEVLEYYGVHNNHLYVSTGLDFVDALTGSVLAANDQTGVALVRGGVNNRLDFFLDNHQFRHFTLFGGPAAISESVENELTNYLHEPAPSFVEHSIIVDENNGHTVIELIGSGVYELVDPEGNEYTVEDDIIDEDGFLSFEYPVEGVGSYEFEVTNEVGVVESFTIEVTEWDLPDISTASLSSWISRGISDRINTIDLSGTNVYQLTDPDGNIFTSEDDLIDDQNNLDYSYRVKQPGEYTFVAENSVGEEESHTVVVTSEDIETFDDGQLTIDSYSNWYYDQDEEIFKYDISIFADEIESVLLPNGDEVHVDENNENVIVDRDWWPWEVSMWIDYTFTEEDIEDLTFVGTDYNGNETTYEFDYIEEIPEVPENWEPTVELNGSYNAENRSYSILFDLEDAYEIELPNGESVNVEGLDSYEYLARDNGEYNFTVYGFSRIYSEVVSYNVTEIQPVTLEQFISHLSTSSVNQLVSSHESLDTIELRFRANSSAEATRIRNEVQETMNNLGLGGSSIIIGTDMRFVISRN